MAEGETSTPGTLAVRVAEAGRSRPPSIRPVTCAAELVAVDRGSAAVVSRAGIFLIFTGASPGSERWYLDRRFQHCITCVRDRQGWTLVDPLDDALSVRRLGPVDPLQLAAANLRLGRVVVAGTRRRQRFGAGRLRANWPSRGNCVGTAKRLMGVEHHLVVTPKQLFRACLSDWGFGLVTSREDA